MLAPLIGKAVWEQRGDIRDFISIWNLAQKNGGSEQVGHMLSTMTMPKHKQKGLDVGQRIMRDDAYEPGIKVR